jgi:hypothetical protein
VALPAIVHFPTHEDRRRLQILGAITSRATLGSGPGPVNPWLLGTHDNIATPRKGRQGRVTAGSDRNDLLTAPRDFFAFPPLGARQQVQASAERVRSRQS